MKVVEGCLLVFRQHSVGILDADVVEAVPLEEHLTSFDVYLLRDTVKHGAVLGTPYG